MILDTKSAYMHNALGVDLGTKRTGLALLEGKYVREYATIETPSDLIAKIVAICQKEDVDRIILGVPVSEDGSESSQAQWVLHKAGELKVALPLPVILEDEYLTTVEARRQLEQQGVKATEIAARIDQYSAKLILEQYLSKLEEA